MLRRYNKPMVPTAPTSPIHNPPRPLRRHVGQPLDRRFLMGMLSDKVWFTQLEEEASRGSDRGSFHAFAESQHSDVRGQIYNLDNGGEVTLPHDRWPHHLFIVIGIHGSVDAHIEGQVLSLRALSQVVVLPGTPCRLTARSAASIEIISLLSMLPRAIE